MKALQAMSEQMSCLVKNQDPNFKPPPHESGMHPSEMWCITCKQAGHTAQFCTMIVQPQVPPYRPPHHVNQPMNPPQGNSQVRQKFLACRTCGGRHVSGTCWVELGIKCSNCGGTHLTDRCRNPKKVIPLNFPPGNYQQQARNNVQGAKHNVPSMDPNPPNLFYDHQNHRQTHHPSAAVQTRQGVIDLAPLQNHGQNHNVRPIQSYPGTQDVRLVDSNQAGPSTMNQKYVT